MSLLPAPIVVIDTETTGFVSDLRSCVVDVGAILVDRDGREVSTFSSLVRPTSWGDWCDGAAAVHGLALEQLADAPEPAEVADSLSGWLNTWGVSRVTSFSVVFDSEMLQRMGCFPCWTTCIQQQAATPMARAGLLEPPGNHGAPVWVDGVEYRPPRLTAACNFFDVEPVAPAHRALSDAKTAARVLVAMARRER